MSAVVVVLVVALAALCFGAFAIHKMNPDKLRIYGESRLAKFGLEISRAGKGENPQGEIEQRRYGLWSA